MNHEKNYLAAIKHYQRNEFDSSAELLESIPDSFDKGSALALKGLIYKINNNHQEAYKALKKYLDKNKNNQVFKAYLDLLLDLHLIEEFLSLTNNSKNPDLIIKKIRKDYLVGDIDLALQKINAIERKNDDLIYLSSLIDLENGNFKIGFENYRSRWNSDLSGIKGKVNAGNLSEWRGEKINNLLILGEQGIGDQIFFARFIPEISEFVDSITLFVDPKIKNLLSDLFSNINITVIDFEKDFQAYDAYLPIACVPRFVNDLNKVSNIFLDYKIIGSKKKVGFSWKSTNPTEEVFRSLPSNGYLD
jgi:tetratricopeptide (TPR) repeat protein